LDGALNDPDLRDVTKIFFAFAALVNIRENPIDDMQNHVRRQLDLP